MNWPKPPNWISIAATTFLGGFVGALTEAVSHGVNLVSWEATRPALATAVVAGLASVVHLYQRAPADVGTAVHS